MDVPCCIFWHILIIKEAAPTGSRVSSTAADWFWEWILSPWSCPALLLVGAQPLMHWDRLSPKLYPNVRLIYLQKSPGLEECTTVGFLQSFPQTPRKYTWKLLRRIAPFLPDWCHGWCRGCIWLVCPVRTGPFFRWPPGASPDRGFSVMTGSFLSISTDAWACQKHKALGKGTCRIFQLRFLK